MSTDIESIIQEHTNRIISGQFSEPTSICPRCLNQPEAFKLHECRKRSFRYIVENLVKITLSLLLRWKCLLCHGTFTDYPDFALPYKRFTRPDIERLSNNYIVDESETHQSVITHENAPIGYQEDDDKPVDRFLVSSSPWRWIDWLGRIKVGLHKVTDRFSKTDAFQIPERKYRSSNRKIILKNAHMILLSHVLQQMGP